MDKIKILKFLSVLSYPTVVAIPLIIALSWNSFLNMIIGIFLISIVPMIILFFHAKKHEIDIDFTDRKTRHKPFQYVLVLYLISAIVFYALQSQIMFTLSIAYFAVTLALAIITTRWKISIHVAGIGGAVIDATYVFGIALLPLFALILAIAWIRLELKAHTKWQVVAGAVVSIVLSFLTFWMLLAI